MYVSTMFWIMGYAQLTIYYSGNGWEYPRAIQAFISSRPDGINFHERNLVGVGHSAGGSTMSVFLSRYFCVTITLLIPFVGSVLLNDLMPGLFSSYILMDPAIIRAQDAHTRVKMERIITQYTWTRQDTWSDRKAARKAIDSQAGSRYWHPMVKEAYVVRSSFF